MGLPPTRPRNPLHSTVLCSEIFNQGGRDRNASTDTRAPLRAYESQKAAHAAASFAHLLNSQIVATCADIQKRRKECLVHRFCGKEP